MEKDTIGDGNPRSSCKTSSSIQRTLVHMDTQGERQQDKFTRVLGNFQRVRQKQYHTKYSTTSKTVQTKQCEKMDKMFCPIVPQQYEHECLVDTMREYHTEYTTTSRTVQDRQCGKMGELSCPKVPQQYKDKSL